MRHNNKPLHVALIGQPSSGKTTLFNALTGYRQKVANYGGVTVNHKTGYFTLPSGSMVKITDLPGIYSFRPISPDEAITYEFFKNNQPAVDIILCVVDATKLRLQLNLVLQVKRLDKPLIVVLNRLEEAQQRGISIDTALLSEYLRIEVIPTPIKDTAGTKQLVRRLDRQPLPKVTPDCAIESSKYLDTLITRLALQSTTSTDEYLDRWVLHPVLGPILLILIIASMSQAIFAWAEPVKQLIENSVVYMNHRLAYILPADSLLYSFINESLLSGVGSILAFCPQILILFAFIFFLEESGYLPRAVFLVDHLLFRAGLTGRALIPLLSSFACTIPSIMATRNIRHARDRLMTILILPLITCSARLPIYVLLITAFVPNKSISYGLLNLQGVILFTLYVIGMISALTVSWISKQLQRESVEPMLLMELPNYQLPKTRDILLGLWEQLRLFLSRIGTIILAVNILLWCFCRFPLPPSDATYPAIYYSFAGQLGQLLAIFFRPIGFNWQICIALIPGLMAREVAIAALATVYMMSTQSTQLNAIIADQWSLATALSLLAWYVFAPQCLSTLTVIQQETGSSRSMMIAVAYLFGLAYLASFITYQVTRLC